MRRVFRRAVLVVAALTSAACTPAAEPAARAAAEQFQSAVGSGDTTAACALLSDEARKSLESATDSTCPVALARLRLSADPVGQISVWGGNAQARLGSEVLFLAEFRTGWRITAAGCTFRSEDLPYDCEVEG